MDQHDNNYNNNQQQPEQPPYTEPQYNPQPPYGGNMGDEPGKNQAIASLVLGIISLLCMFTFVSMFIGLILGIVGAVMASMSKKAGYQGNLVTAGMVLSIIGIVLNGLFFVACAICVGSLGALGAFY